MLRPDYLTRLHRLLNVLCLAGLTVLPGCGGGGDGGDGGSGGGNVSNPISHNLWTWISGSDVVNAAGVYGTLGVAANGNVPGAREFATSWSEGNNLWLFGGHSIDGTGTAGDSNDLWKFDGTRWTWVSGSDVVNVSGTYGSLGVAANGNVPGARELLVSWTDKSGHLWLFGGQGYDGTGTTGDLNDLWEFNGTSWTWMSGSDVVNASGIYGTQGIAANGNVPGARFSAVSWTDTGGHLWLFGGQGFDSAGTDGNLNDLWEYDGTSWAWISGSDLANASGSYGTLGVPANGNVPGAREAAISWTDANGNLWLFGGNNYGSGTGTTGVFNDLWKFDGTRWTWVSGSDALNVPGTYGTLGVAANGNVPGARYSAVSWIDGRGNLWLFGGYGYDSAGTLGYLNDLWKFDGARWTWVSGSNEVRASGSYGTQGVTADNTVPGAREAAISWTSSQGDLWLFGGYSVDSAGTLGDMNDLWRYQP